MSLNRQQQKDQAATNFPTNGKGEINAQIQRLFLRTLIDAVMQPEDLVQTWTGNESSRPLSAAGGKALYDALIVAATAIAAQVKSELLGGASPAFDTLAELALQLTSDESAASVMLSRIGLIETNMLFGGPSMATNVPFSLTTAASFLLGTTKNVANMTFIPQEVNLILRSFSGTIVTAAVVSIGTNAPAYDNIATRQLVGVNSSSIGTYIPLSFNAFEVAPNTPVYANVKAIQVGATGTLDVFLTGLYRQK